MVVLSVAEKSRASSRSTKFIIGNVEDVLTHVPTRAHAQTSVFFFLLVRTRLINVSNPDKVLKN